jgi:hypothetical protein
MMIWRNRQKTTDLEPISVGGRKLVAGLLLLLAVTVALIVVIRFYLL